MSRSYKKHGILKDGGGGRSYNGIFRSRNKQQVRLGKEPFLMKELINQWDVCDWKSHWKGETYYRHQIRWCGRYLRFSEEDIIKMKRQYFNK